MKNKYATKDEMIEYLYNTMLAIAEHKDNWRLNAGDRHRLDLACSELNIVIENLKEYQ